MKILEKVICHSLNFVEKSLGINPPMVTVLNYHSISNEGTMVDVSTKNFKKQINFLKSNFNFISLNQVVDHMEGKILLKKPSVALTFDDGYADLVDNLVPLLLKENIPAAVFVLSDPKKADRTELANNKKIISIKQVLKLKNIGWIIGSHGATHACLLDKTNLEKEIKQSKKKLENVLHSNIKYFAYPKGLYNQRVLKKVKLAGFKAAFTTSPGFIFKRTNRHKIPRLGIDHTHSIWEFKSMLTTWGRTYLTIKEFITKFFQRCPKNP